MGKYCCVPNCHNSREKNPELQFYSFPKRAHEAARREKWIRAVAKRGWLPNDNSRICSAHFVGNEKSNNPQNEAYIPTIFPSSTIEKKKTPNILRSQNKPASQPVKSKESFESTCAGAELSSFSEVGLNSKPTPNILRKSKSLLGSKENKVLGDIGEIIINKRYDNDQEEYNQSNDQLSEDNHAIINNSSVNNDIAQVTASVESPRAASDTLPTEVQNSSVEQSFDYSRDEYDQFTEVSTKNNRVSDEPDQVKVVYVYCKCSEIKHQSVGIQVDESCFDENQNDTKSTHPAWAGFSSIAHKNEQNRDKEIRSFTGIDWHFFQVLLSFIKPGEPGQEKYYRKLNSANRLLLFLMKMKLGISFTILGSLFSVSRATATTIFLRVLKTIRYETSTWIFWPSKEAIQRTTPASFKNYPDVRVILVDCTEIFCGTPPTVEQRVLTYSNYKGWFTIKYLIGISPSGLIIFLSDGYRGKATDCYIVNDSGFLKLLEPGDVVMADKGFPEIATDLLQQNCTLVMPPFSLQNQQFTHKEVITGYNIASVRIQVERGIQRIKIFKILDFVPIELLPHIDDIVYVAAVLANNKDALIREERLR